MATSLRESVDNACCFRPLSGGLTRMVFEITRKCNLNCIHCMVPCDYGKTEKLDQKRLVRLMNELPENNISKIMFTGGEPLLAENIVEYIKLASAQGIIVDLNSNLTLLDENLAEELLKAGIKEVTTSIDGDEETHCRIRGNKECFQKTLKGIELLRSKNIAVDIVCMAMKSNINKLSEVITLATNLEVSSITFSGLILAGRASKLEQNIDFDKLKTEISHLRATSKIPIRTVRLFNEDFSICHKGEDMISIDYLGDIHPCLQSKMKNPMNIADCSLKDGIAYMKANIPRRSCEYDSFEG